MEREKAELAEADLYEELKGLRPQLLQELGDRVGKAGKGWEITVVASLSGGGR